MATIKDVAKKSGVGVGTVSRFLNNPELVSEKAKEKIRLAISQTGYVRNEIGRSLKTNNPRNIALLVPSIFHNFFSAFAFNLEQELSKKDYRITICNSLTDVKKDKFYIDMLEAGKISGIVGFVFTDVDKLIHENMPFISMDRNFSNKVTRVSSDNYDGGYLAASYLNEIGCKKIGFVGTYSKSIDTDVKNRRNGFIKYVKEYNLDYIEYVVLDPIKDYELMIKELFDNYLLGVDGIFVENDNLALLIIEKAKKRGIDVPYDLSVIGYDGNPFQENQTPKLTTITQPIQEMTQVVAQELINIIENKSNTIKDIKIKPRLTIGDTTKQI